MREKKLYRSTTDKKIAGICGGLGEYLNVDPTIIRVAAVILAFISAGTAAAVYILLIWVIPEDTGSPEPRKKV
jgi:phage shock protein C